MYFGQNAIFQNISPCDLMILLAILTNILFHNCCIYLEAWWKAPGMEMLACTRTEARLFTAVVH